MDNFLVSARKYRPLRWIDVAGQDHITNTLKSALQQGQVAHAFLFTGPRGVGKTTCARILARVLNCSNPTKDWEPCNTCEMCIAFQENASFNIFELDAASNNGVEHIRSLVEQVRYQPQYGKYKIYIIDEVHMLSSAAFNAFLKTLEEPPPFAKFILATTEKHKILPTILSRCQVYDFKRIKEKDIVKNLEKIANQENIKADQEALYLIAQKADGGMRDALSIFDRITSYSGHEISYNDAVANLNVLDQDYYFKFIDSFLTENIQSAYLLFDQVLQSGFDPDVFLDGIGSHLRNLLVCKHPQMQSLFEGSETWKQKYIEQANAIELSFIMSSLDLINEAEVNLIRAKNRRLHIEVLLGKLCFLQRRKNNPILGIPSLSEKKLLK
ncbi:MAG: DNA polymerase III subunit gamma/tau [Saprospiraceae bacterium]|nr:DNA polymerase III subunit gamma/tau [Saprospiraceae bacterium]